MYRQLFKGALSTVIITTTTVAVALPMVVLSGIYTEKAAIAFNIPNFSPRVNVDGNRVNLYLPAAPVQGTVNEILRANQGRLKDTTYNRISIFDMQSTLSGEVIRVDGSWRVEHREKIACVLGRCKYTPWVSVSGRFSQNFNMQVAENRLLLRPVGKVKLSGNSRW